MLLRASAVTSKEPAKKRDVAEIRDLGIEIVGGDLVKNSIDELASVFARYDTVIGCAGHADEAGGSRVAVRDSALFPLTVRRRFRSDRSGRPAGHLRRPARRSGAAAFAGQDRVGHHLDRDVHELSVRAGVQRRRPREQRGSRPREPRHRRHPDHARRHRDADRRGRVFEPTIRNEVVFLAGDTVTYGEVAAKLEAGLDRPLGEPKAESIPQHVFDLSRKGMTLRRKHHAARRFEKMKRGAIA